ncbi:MAG: hypothetical protein QM756_11065 [Polyangiaceae bacterium]
MDIDTLKAHHPDVFAAAKREGRAEEQSRVKAHLKLGRTCGDINFAIKQIEEGVECTADVQAEYMSIALNTKRQKDRQDDSDAAGAVLDGAVSESKSEKDFGDLVCDALGLPPLTPEQAARPLPATTRW